MNDRTQTAALVAILMVASLTFPARAEPVLASHSHEDVKEYCGAQAWGGGVPLRDNAMCQQNLRDQQAINARLQQERDRDDAAARERKGLAQTARTRCEWLRNCPGW